MTAPSETSKSAVKDDEDHPRGRARGAAPAGGGSPIPVTGLLQATAEPPPVAVTAGSRARPGLIQRLLSSHALPVCEGGRAAPTGSAAGVIRRAPKRKAEGSDSEENSSSDESEEEQGRSVRSGTRKQTEDRNKKKPRTNTRPGRGDRAAAAEEEEAEPDFRVSEPALYEGMRGALWFYKNVTTAMDLLPKACVECAGTVKLAIDHINPISEEMSEVDTALYCYGGRHYEAATFVDALSMYNARLPSTGTITPAQVGKHFQWMCGACNSSKGGNKGIDSAVPQLKGKCPDGDDCGEHQIQATGARRKTHSDYE